MKGQITFDLEGDAIRFTPNGKIAVLDAIGAMGDVELPDRVWEDLKRDNPRINGMCEEYAFPNDDAVPVADWDSWEIIQTLLFDYMIDAKSR